MSAYTGEGQKLRTRSRTIQNLIAVVLVGAVILLLHLDESVISASLMGYGVLILNLLSIMRVRHNWYLVFIYLCIAYSNYSICATNYISRINTYFSGYAGSEIGIRGLYILLGFSLLLYLIAPSTKEHANYSVKKALIVNNRYNPIIVIGADIILILIWIYGFARPDVIGKRGSPSALYEYSIIFIIISIFYSGANKKLSLSTTFIGIMFALQNFVFGGRITGVQIVVLIIYSLYIDQLRIGTAIPIALIGFLLMSAIGQIRGLIIINGFNVFDVISRLIEGKFALDTAYSSYFTSMTFLDVLERTSFSKRLYLFSRWVLSMFLGGGAVADSNLAHYTRQQYIHYNGGVLPYFGWFYLGLLGVFLLSLYLRYHFVLAEKSDSNSSGLSRCVALYVTCTCLRWYLYSPSQLFRGVMLLCIVYSICYVADCMLNRKPIRLVLKYK